MTVFHAELQLPDGTWLRHTNLDDDLEDLWETSFKVFPVNQNCNLRPELYLNALTILFDYDGERETTVMFTCESITDEDITLLLSDDFGWSRICRPTFTVIRSGE